VRQAVLGGWRESRQELYAHSRERCASLCAATLGVDGGALLPSGAGKEAAKLRRRVLGCRMASEGAGERGGEGGYGREKRRPPKIGVVFPGGGGGALAV